MDKLVIHDEETLDQLRSYRRDKEVQSSTKFEIVNPGKVQSGRRSRHHWDRVSALLWSCWMARKLPAKYRRKPREETLEEIKEAEEKLQEDLKVGLTYNQQQAVRKDLRRLKRGRERALRKGPGRYKRSTK